MYLSNNRFEINNVKNELLKQNKWLVYSSLLFENSTQIKKEINLGKKQKSSNVSKNNQSNND